MSNDHAAFLSAAELLDAYARRELSPVEVTQTVLDRIERLDPQLNAYLVVDRDGALAAAREAERIWARPDGAPLLCGVPVSIKDLIHTDWLPTTMGSLLLEDYVPPRNAPVVDRLREVGAVIVGKTNTPEFGLLDVTHNRLRDHCRNPWSLDHTAGGSSGGAGAAVAAGLAPLAIGTDGAGSIRIPSLHCGLFGLKPTFGRVAHDGWKGSPRTSHQGPMTRTVRDAALIMQAAAGPDPRDPMSLHAPVPDFPDALAPREWRGTKVALSVDYGSIPVDDEVRRAVLDAAELLRSFGCELIESHPPRLERYPHEADPTPPEEYAFLLELRPDATDHLDQLTGYGRRVIEAGIAMPGWKYAAALRSRYAWADATHRWFEDFDYLLAPVMGETAPRCDAQRRFDGEHPWPGNFLPIFNNSGNPAASVPFGTHSNGLPLAVQIVARHGDDTGVLRLAAAIEDARPWAGRWPALARPSHMETPAAGD